MGAHERRNRLAEGLGFIGKPVLRIGIGAARFAASLMASSRRNDAIDTEALPRELLQAIATPGGGRVALVVGAGCSKDGDTDLPLSSDLAMRAFEEMVENGDLSVNDCAEPSDLSLLADAVHRRHGSQAPLVECFPIGRMRSAPANDGYKLAAALLMERAVLAILTLNFDLALTTALGQLGARESVSVINGPEAIGQLGPFNVIYLHRNVDANPEDLVLRSAVMENDWLNTWQAPLSHRVLTAPVTVFAGLGSRAAVLVTTTKFIRARIDVAHAFLVDPGPREASKFWAELKLPSHAYIRLGWSAFMHKLSQRLVATQVAELRRISQDLVAREGWDSEDLDQHLDRILLMGLIDLGRLRSSWLLQSGEYTAATTETYPWLADLMLAVAFVERATGTKAEINPDGTVTFLEGSKVRGLILVAHGRGELRRASLEATLNRQARRWRLASPQPSVVLASGVVGSLEEPHTPARIVDEPRGDLIPKKEVPPMVSVEGVRSRTDLTELFVR